MIETGSALKLGKLKKKRKRKEVVKQKNPRKQTKKEIKSKLYFQLDH